MQSIGNSEPQQRSGSNEAGGYNVARLDHIASWRCPDSILASISKLDVERAMILSQEGLAFG